MKKVLGITRTTGRHWVGDGFPVHGMFGYSGPDVPTRSPFLLLDYAAPVEFKPNEGYRRGVGQHPHRGFETVTIVYEGEVEHRDSTGNGGVIGKGDVQWMTAGSGILHEEFHSERYSREGGPFEMVQLWVNLPAKDKMVAPGYQVIIDKTIPAVPLPDGAGIVRVIAGNLQGFEGPANTFSPMNVWDVRLNASKKVSLPQEPGWTAMVVVLEGTVEVNGDSVLRPAEMATLSAEGGDITLEASGDAKVLLLAGEPIDEPVVGYGPFVMNTQAEIAEAIRDFNSGKFGQMHH
ncbi:MAG: pirin family protein [Pseudomonadota bacterium]|nr:pirin family protein [Pseudomonadota bacterium]